MTLSRRRARSLLIAALVALASLVSLTAVPGALASPAGPAAHADRTCSVRADGQKLGPTYVTALSVSGGATCGQGKSLTKAYFTCRRHHGGVKGHCSSVSGYRCTEKRYSIIPTQYSAKVVCTRGKKVVRHTYTQFT